MFPPQGATKWEERIALKVLSLFAVLLFWRSKVWEMVEAEKCPHLREPVYKWYSYSQNWKVGNNSPMDPLHYPSVRLLHTSKIRQIIRDI